ncbi:DUF2911 domain-containing protein [Reichenbachiella sp.]|uniref:DUF2911 domain-containing protein n=1 Tax=Reichenbachiella sp. TaxID=2184521 RepID=UPI003BAEB347
MTKKINLLIIAALYPSFWLLAQELYVPQASPKAAIEQTVGVCNIRVEYSRPSVKDRPIFGGLVPYGKVWRAGANAATVLSFDQDINIAGNKVAAGRYGLFIIPTEEKWTIILNRQWNQWGAYNYDSNEDVLRFKVHPSIKTFTEMCTFSFLSVTKTSAILQLAWEKTAIHLPIETSTQAQTLAEIDRTTQVLKNGWYTFSAAAQYHFYELKQNQKALAYIEMAIVLDAPNPSPWMLKSQILATQGKYAEAITTAEQAIQICKKTSHEFEIDENEENIRLWKSRL